jgi:hypothetical protein
VFVIEAFGENSMEAMAECDRLFKQSLVVGLLSNKDSFAEIQNKVHKLKMDRHTGFLDYPRDFEILNHRESKIRFAPEGFRPSPIHLLDHHRLKELKDTCFKP